MSKDYFSVASEPALHAENIRETVQAELAVDTAEVPEIERIRDSVYSEPGFAGSGQGGDRYREWLERQARTVGNGKVIGVTLLAGLLGGLVSVPGAFLAGYQSAFQAFYLVLFGPVIEEFMKQSGMIFLLEKKPYMLKRSWQFWLAALLASLIFASLENLLYGHFYLRSLAPDKLAAIMAFRWKYCTALHVGCALIAAAGLQQAWKRHLVRGVPAEFGDAFPGMTAAMAVHGLYNLLGVTGIIDPAG